jgi:hypothetical protein
MHVTIDLQCAKKKTVPILNICCIIAIYAPRALRRGAYKILFVTTCSLKKSQRIGIFVYALPT